MISGMSSKFNQIRRRTAKLTALEHLEKSYTYNGGNVVNTLHF